MAEHAGNKSSNINEAKLKLVIHRNEFDVISLRCRLLAFPLAHLPSSRVPVMPFSPYRAMGISFYCVKKNVKKDTKLLPAIKSSFSLI